MKLNQLSDIDGATKKRTRVGRGVASGKGKTSGRGQKGQKARNTVAVGFEGGQMPIYRRTPKRGFTSISKKEFAIVNLGRIQKAITAGKLNTDEVITIDVLKKTGLVGKNLKSGVRVLAKGEITQKVNLEVNSFSKKATEIVEKLGGTISIV